jgi:hypothetical protein
MAGLALVAPVSPPAANAAVARRPAPIHLQNALLTTADLPRGYAAGASGSTTLVSNLSVDTNICDHHISHNSLNSAQATFIRGVPGPMLFETLSVTGPRAARAIVAAVAAAPRLCRHSSAPGVAAGMRFAPLRVPRLGDASAGLAFTVRPLPLKMTVQGKLISVARGGVAVTILLVNSPRNDQRELNLIAAGAIRKLDRVL